MSDTTFDMESAVEQVSEQLFPVQETPPDLDDSLEGDDPTGPVNTATVTPVPDTPPVLAAPVAEGATPVPSSFRKDLAPIWETIPKAAQDYYVKREQDMLKGLEQYKHTAEEVGFARNMQQVLQPFDPILKAQGLDAPRAVQYLLTAHQRLTQGSPESRQEAYQELGRNLGLQPGAAQGTPTPTDPVLHSLQQKMAQIEQNLTARQQADYQAAQERVSKEVDAFASDPAHPHFSEVADDIVLLLKTGLPLADAYEKAVWANPMTREKQLVERQTADLTKAKETARLNALPKAKAARTNVRSLESRRAPTESLGTLEDTIKTALAEARSRV
jgi:hypothetical protein